jgi:hypothetical protein
MADTITIVEQDRIDAENVLEQFMGDRLENVDFSKGGAVRDFVISAMGLLFAYLQSEKDTTRARQSLLLLGKLTGSDVDDAVDEILSNWFIRRGSGQYATGTVKVYLTAAVDVSIPLTARFYKTSSLPFAPNATDTLTYSTDDLTQIVDSTGTVVAYTFTVPVIAANPGEAYNVSAGTFVDYTRFSPYVSRVENESAFTGGGDKESTQSMLERSETAISVRDLNSARSIDVTLKEEFSDVNDVVVIGYGDPEMIRDLVLEEATNTRIHAGGYVDSYLRTPVLESQTFVGTVGGVFTDPRSGYFVLRDYSVADFSGVAVGDVLLIQNAITSSEANQYIVKQVTPYGIYVSRRTPFPKALPTVSGDAYTDGAVSKSGLEQRVTSVSQYTFSADDVGNYIAITDAVNAGNLCTGKIISVNTGSNYAVVTGVAGGYDIDFTSESDVTFEIQTRVVEYSIGNNAPGYNNKVTERYSGRFTKSIQNDGRVLLPARPIYQIRDVSLPGTDYSTGYPALLDTDGRVRFPNRVNQEPVSHGTGPELEYEVVCQNPEEAQSGWQVMELDVAWATDKTFFNDEPLTVIYDTLTGFDTVWAFMLSDDRRIICGSVIPRGLHPVYLILDVKYKLAKTATANLDEEAAADALAEFVNNFDSLEDIDSSDIAAFLRQEYSEIGYIAPSDIDYQLLAPDGRVITYRSDSQVTVDDTTKQIDPATGLYPTDPNLILADPISQGVSDNTVRYLTTPSMITFTNLEA